MLQRILLGAALLAGCSTDMGDAGDRPGAAITGVELDQDGAANLADQTAQADVVFVGDVIAIGHQLSAPDAEGQRLPFTLVTWRIAEPLKGTRDATYTVRFLGGPLGDRQLQVAEIPEFAVGDRELLFVRDNGLVGCPLVGGASGRIRIGVKPDGLSRSAPSARWLAGATETVRTASAGAALVVAPDLTAPFVFDPPRPATHAEKLAAASRTRTRQAPPAHAVTAEQAAYDANHQNPVLAR